jgi:hypothetical protein
MSKTADEVIKELFGEAGATAPIAESLRELWERGLWSVDEIDRVVRAAEGTP